MQSNYYASKVFQEHPLAIWPFDEDVTYVSAIRQDGKDDLEGWDGDDLTITRMLTRSFDIPVERLPVYKVVPTDDAEKTLMSQPIEIDTPLDIPFAVSAYVMCQSTVVQAYEIGIVTEAGTEAWTVFNGVSFGGAIENDWVRIFANFDQAPARFRVYIKFSFINADSPGVDAKANIYVNGVAAGELSRNFVSYDDGVITYDKPDHLNTLLGSTIRVEPAVTYGFDTTPDAYYCIECPDPSVWHNALPLAKNDGIPMVFGASNSTAIYQFNGQPGIVFDAKGFLHDNGRYNESTMELWLRQGRINKALPKVNESNTPIQQAIRFLGPLNGNDGLWRDDTHIYLCVDDQIASYQIGVWYRPMLIALQYRPGYLVLFVNGEQVASVSFDRDKAVFDAEQWWGIYNVGLDLFEIDCLAIFPYSCPDALIKRRYAVGQGVDEVENIDSMFLGRSWVVDYPRANYNRNISYPKVYSWTGGQYSNIWINNIDVSLPEYEKPELVSQRTHGQWIKDNASLQIFPLASFFVSPPQWKNNGAYLRWPKINFLDDGTRALQIDFYVTASQDGKELFRLHNKALNKTITFKVEYLENKILIKATYENNTLSTALINAGRARLTIDFRAFMTTAKFKKFFESFNNIELTMGQPSNYYTNRYFAVSFFNAYTAMFLGLPSANMTLQSVSTSSDLVLGNYTYATRKLINTFDDFILGSGTWKDTVPLSMFTKEYIGKKGKRYYRVDLLQFNAWLDDNPATGLRDKMVTTIEFTKNPLAQDRVGEYAGTDISRNRVLTLPADYLNKEYVVRNGTVILFENQVNPQDLFVILRIRLTSLGQNFDDVHLQKVELCGIATKVESGFYAMGTRYGNRIYPADRNDTRYYAVTKAAVRIGKETAPYLRLTEDSGIAILPQQGKLDPTIFEESVSQIVVPLNRNRDMINPELIAGFKFWVQLDEAFLSNISKEKKIADLLLTTKNGTMQLDFVVVPHYAGTERPNLYTLEFRNESGTLFPAMILQNIYQTETPVLEPRRWTQIAVVFSDNLEIVDDSFLNLYSGAMFQNISVHEPTLTSISERVARRAWLQVKYGPDSESYVATHRTRSGNNVTLTIGTHDITAGEIVEVNLVEDEDNGLYSVTSVVPNVSITFVHAGASTTKNVSGSVVRPSIWNYWAELRPLESSPSGERLWSDVLYLNKPRNYYFDALSMTQALFGTLAIVSDSNRSDIRLNTTDMDSVIDVKWKKQEVKPV